METPASQLCGGNFPVRELVTDQLGNQVWVTVKPPNSCGSRSFEEQEECFLDDHDDNELLQHNHFHSNGFFQSFVAYDTYCTDNRVDVLVDMQDPITSLTPWLFGKLGNTKDYFISAADKTGDCNNLFLTAPDCSATSFANLVTVQ